MLDSLGHEYDEDLNILNQTTSDISYESDVNEKINQNSIPRNELSIIEESGHEYSSFKPTDDMKEMISGIPIEKGKWEEASLGSIEDYFVPKTNKKPTQIIKEMEDGGKENFESMEQETKIEIKTDETFYSSCNSKTSSMIKGKMKYPNKNKKTKTLKDGFQSESTSKKTNDVPQTEESLNLNLLFDNSQSLNSSRKKKNRRGFRNKNKTNSDSDNTSEREIIEQINAIEDQEIIQNLDQIANEVYQ
jgi:hypothetical protein